MLQDSFGVTKVEWNNFRGMVLFVRREFVVDAVKSGRSYEISELTHSISRYVFPPVKAVRGWGLVQKVRGTAGVSEELRWWVMKELAHYLLHATKDEKEIKEWLKAKREGTVAAMIERENAANAIGGGQAGVGGDGTQGAKASGGADRSVNAN